MPRIKIEWMTPRHESQILEINRSVDYDDLMSRKIIGTGFKVITCDGDLVGYVVFKLKRTCVRIVEFYISPSQRRKGYGRRLMRDMLDPTDKEKTHVVVRVSGRDTRAHLFLRSCGMPYLRTDKNGDYVFSKHRNEVSVD